jgi:hypothetical protein
MGFFKRFAELIGGNRGDDNRYLDIYALDHRCREPVQGRVDLFNELSREDEGKGFFTRKVLHTSGAKRCFGQVEVELWFDSKKKLIDHTISGGRWLSAEEYKEELARFNAPPEEEEDQEEDQEIEESADDDDS